jgi:hypothetical protein
LKSQLKFLRGCPIVAIWWHNGASRPAHRPSGPVRRPQKGNHNGSNDDPRDAPDPGGISAHDRRTGDRGAGVLGSGRSDREPHDQVNPPAQKRPGVRIARTCTVDAVPGSNGNSRRGGGGFGFTGPAEFYTDGRMTCYRAKAVMRFRLGYSRLEVHDCNGRQYTIAGFRDGRWDLVTLDAFSTQVVRRRRLP